MSVIPDINEELDNLQRTSEEIAPFTPRNIPRGEGNGAQEEKGLAQGQGTNVKRPWPVLRSASSYATPSP